MEVPALHATIDVADGAGEKESLGDAAYRNAVFIAEV